ncbi:MAG: hypothetical protein R3281_15295 [Balneolaceae bacterium]|nr:hypothetical protein [Balneolaceae bacterium]
MINKPKLHREPMIKELRNFICELLLELYDKEQCEATSNELTTQN